ncbi:hypothetical protein [Lentzea flaviverrucosa]|uniref:Uncharacterized protein n=1 Tax=Lentzea flaviverrucosa TaxID=200379 RepID=A0A1H9AUG9_9PSEU|nr:hypothetical protein [Lentzea flaviverrucosa]RDI31961.1 hypothetical protein DFR72_103362 [Lentzea flaviverrucosa]SEP80424.1 hypothetical protein SAMN05216195_101296 [Lentzea flaviverrucosa]
MTRRSPQEKKALSYARDARNCYGQSDKGSRKAIARNKRANVRADRRREQVVLVQARPDDIDSELKRERLPSKRWRKLADAPLADVVAGKLRRRAAAGIIDEEQAEAKIARMPRVSRRTP